jgi:DNA polymerase
VLDGPAGAAALDLLRPRALVCQKCKLHEGRTKAVFGEGRSNQPAIGFVGEAPGENEDRLGRPFVGKAGELLNRMLGAMELKREEVYICNVVCCRPPENRKPEEEEIRACAPFLIGQLRAVKPRIIVALGATAVLALLKWHKKLGDLRGRWFDWEGIPLRVTYHPAYLLRNPAAKGAAWEDLVAVNERLGRTAGGKDDHGREQGHREGDREAYEEPGKGDRGGDLGAHQGVGGGDPGDPQGGHCF